jgi:hypothetical protein
LHAIPTLQSPSFGNVPIAGAKAETVLLARAIAAKAPMMVEKRNILRNANNGINLERPQRA